MPMERRCRKARPCRQRPVRLTPASDRNSSQLILVTPRVLLIPMVTLIVGLLPAVVVGLIAGLYASPALGPVRSIAVGVASGVVTLVLTGLVVATKLHKLVRYVLVEASTYSKAYTRCWGRAVEPTSSSGPGRTRITSSPGGGAGR